MCWFPFSLPGPVQKIDLFSALTSHTRILENCVDFIATCKFQISRWFVTLPLSENVYSGTPLNIKNVLRRPYINDISSYSSVFIRRTLYPLVTPCQYFSNPFRPYRMTITRLSDLSTEIPFKKLRFRRISRNINFLRMAFSEFYFNFEQDNAVSLE